jgi:hypothetical protein
VSIWTLVSATPNTTVEAGAWSDPIPNLTVRLDFGLAVRINLPAREEHAARLLTELIEQATRVLASIPDTARPQTPAINRQ